KSTFNQAICSIVPDEKIILNDYLYYTLLSEREGIAKKKIHRTQDNLNKTKLENYEIPLIKDPKIQKKFISEMQEFEKTL
ncbi:unnamed protein product, partial [marine sediment metagenome]